MPEKMSKNDQGELFSQNQHGLTPKKLARTEHPVTSKMAADRAIVFLGHHHRKIYDALTSMPDGTFYEIAEEAGMSPSSVWRRLNELEKIGWIGTTGALRHGPTGRLCRVWIAYD